MDLSKPSAQIEATDSKEPRSPSPEWRPGSCSSEGSGDDDLAERVAALAATAAALEAGMRCEEPLLMREGDRHLASESTPCHSHASPDAKLCPRLTRDASIAKIPKQSSLLRPRQKGQKTLHPSPLPWERSLRHGRSGSCAMTNTTSTGVPVVR